MMASTIGLNLASLFRKPYWESYYVSVSEEWWAPHYALMEFKSHVADKPDGFKIHCTSCTPTGSCYSLQAGLFRMLCVLEDCLITLE